jgi:DNA-binding transcriptional regulator LsrR (DeoR family)
MENTYGVDELRNLLQATRDQRIAKRAKRSRDIQEMAKLHLIDKLSYADIGKKYGITRQRVHQLINTL